MRCPPGPGATISLAVRPDPPRGSTGQLADLLHVLGGHGGDRLGARLGQGDDGAAAVLGALALGDQAAPLHPTDLVGDPAAVPAQRRAQFART